jgi:hypothetical protein
MISSLNVTEELMTCVCGYEYEYEYQPTPDGPKNMKKLFLKEKKTS